MTKNDRLDRCIATQMPDAAEHEADGELKSSNLFCTSDTNLWPAIREAVHAYAKEPSDENALAVEANMLLLRQQRDAAQQRHPPGPPHAGP